MPFQVFFVLLWINIAQITATTTVAPHTSTTSAAGVDDETSTSCISYQGCLYNDLFRYYNKYVRPKKDHLGSVEIGVTLNIRSLREIVEKEETMTIFGHLRCNWVDEFLQWNTSNYGGVDHIIIPAEQIWLPDIAITNSVSEFYDITYKRDFHVEVKSNGHVRWSFGGILTTTCDIDLKDYPFDVQKCPLVIENWRYKNYDVNLNFNPGDPVDISTLEPSSVFYFEGSEATTLLEQGEYSSLRFSLIWRRKTLYYYINIVTPIILMIFVALGVFWLPADCGEKMSLAVTILLAFSVFQIIVMDNTPVNSDVVPQMTSLVMLVSILATISLLTSMLVVYISSKSPVKRPPTWLRSLCFNCVAKVLCMKSDNSPESMSSVTSDTSKCKSKTQASSNNIQELESILQELLTIKTMLKEKEAESFIESEWKFVAKVADRCVFWVVFTVFLCSFFYVLFH